MGTWTIIGFGAISIAVGLIAQLIMLHRARPKAWYRGVGILYEPGAIQPWPGLERAIDVMLDTLREEWPTRATEIGEFWVRVVPWNGNVVGFFVPTAGHLIAGHGRSGTVDRFSAFLGFYRRYILVVRQREERPATESAIFHEFCEHLVPFLLYGNWNFERDGQPQSPEWLALTTRMEERAR